MAQALNRNRHSVKNIYTPVRRPTPISQRRGASSQAAGALDINLNALRKAAVWVGGLLVVLFLFFSLSYGLLFIYRYSTTSEYFALNDISITGLYNLSEEEIQTLSGIHLGDNVLSIHIPEIEKRLLNNPWIANISIKRVLPDKFIIDIEERNPQFWVLKDGKLNYLDAQGLVISPVDNRNFISLPTLDVGVGGDEALALLPQFMEEIYTTKLPFDLLQVSWLRLSAGKGFELYWESKQLSLSIDVDDWKKNMHRMAMVLEDLEQRGETDKIREIRATDGQVWLRKL